MATAALSTARTSAPRALATAKPTARPPLAKKKKPPTLAQAMHRALYPDLYQDGRQRGIMMGMWKSEGWFDGRYRRVQGVREEGRRRWFWGKLGKGAEGKTLPSARAIKKTCPDPIKTLTTTHLAVLDPTGARTRLFAKDNPECARVGDIVLVRQRTGEPFAGVLIDIRRRGVDTAILLRGQLTRVGVEMWYKVYSPLVEGIEVVQRAQRRARRARLTYMRKVKHDRGSVENVVRMYLRQKAALGSAEAGKKNGAKAATAVMGGKKKGAKKGKKR